MKKYKKPVSILIELDGEELLAASPGVDNGSGLGNEPVKDGTFYSKGQNGLIIDDEDDEQ